jgi:uncharacterized protein YqiB (DUF1249 family)
MSGPRVPGSEIQRHVIQRHIRPCHCDSHKKKILPILYTRLRDECSCHELGACHRATPWNPVMEYPSKPTHQRYTHKLSLNLGGGGHRVSLASA